jgi:hypothetical protein
MYDKWLGAIMTIETWNIKEITGYEPITTFYDDFSIADKFGAEAIKDTYNRAFKEWKHDYKYLTELIMALNWKCWRWSEKDQAISKLYTELFQTAYDYAIENLKGEELSYFIRTTD